MVRGKNMLLLLFLIFLLLWGQGGVALGATKFCDIEGHWAQAAVEGLAEVGLLQGYGDGTFRPQAQITRGQFISLLVQAARIPESAYYPPTFSDVPVTDATLYRYVESAAHAGIIRGDGAKFYPDRPLEREQLAVMVIKALGEDVDADADVHSQLHQFDDAAAISPWARGAVARAVEMGILSGRVNKFAPQDTTSRAEAAVVVWKVWNLTRSQGTATDPAPEGDSLSIISPTQLCLNFAQPINTRSLDGNFNLLYRNTALSPGPVRHLEVVNSRQLILTVPELEPGEEYSLLIRDLRTAAGERLTDSGPLVYHFSLKNGQDAAHASGEALPPEAGEVKQVPGTNDRLEVVFSQPLDPKSAAVVANYQITLADDLTAEVEVKQADVQEDGQKVVLTLAEPLQYGIGYRYYISGVKDAQGDKMLPRADYFQGGWGTGDSLVAAVQILSATELEVTFARNVRQQYQPGNYGVVDVVSGNILPVVAVEEGSSTGSVRLFLGEKMTKGEDYLVSAGRGILDPQGNSLGTFTGRVTARFDLVPPRLKKIESLDSQRFRLIFDKEVERLLVDLPGYEFRVRLYGHIAIVELRDRQFALGSNYQLRLWADGREEAAATTSWQEATLQVVKEVKAPQVELVTAATSHQIKVQFDKPVAAAAAEDPDNYRLFGLEEGQGVYPIRADYDPATFTVYLTLPAGRALTNAPYYLEVQAIRDSMGNTVSTRSYGFYGVDTTPPQVHLPPLVNYKGYALVIADSESPGTDYLYGEAGAVESEVYVKAIVNGQTVAVRQAKKDGSFAKLPLGDLSGRNTITLEIIDSAGNYAQTTREYNFY
jgi:hypothetical protein